MAKAWFTYMGDHKSDGFYNPDNYSLVKVQPDYINGTLIGAINAESEIIDGKFRPLLTTELVTEISIAKISCRPSSNVLLKH